MDNRVEKALKHEKEGIVKIQGENLFDFMLEAFGGKSNFAEVLMRYQVLRASADIISLQRDDTDPGYVYFISDGDRVKIGYTAISPHKRMRQFSIIGKELRLWGFIETYKYKEIEKELHVKLAKYKVKGEWFILTRRQVDKVIDEYQGR